MKQEFTITLDGVEYPIIAEGDSVSVNGRPFTVEVDEDGAVLVDGIGYDTALEGETATVGGQAYTVQVKGLSLSAAAPSALPSDVSAPSVVDAGSGAVLAIMPGKIVRVMVELGEEVAEGQPVCVLEAMKMENELQARQSGTVRALHVKPGDDVEKDQVLVEIE